jgi:hypothetical protein
VLLLYGVGESGSNPRRGTRFFSSPHHPDRLWSPPSLLTNGSVSLGVRRPGREADRSLLSSAEVKNGGAIPPLPHTSSWRGS